MKHNPKVTSTYQKNKQWRLQEDSPENKYFDKIVEKRYQERLKRRDLTKDRRKDNEAIN